MTTTPPIAVGASLGVLSRRLEVTPRALRYYEHRGLISVARDRWNCRRYDAAAQRQVEIVVRLRRCGLGVEAIAETLARYRAGEPIAAQLLPCLKARLSDLAAQSAAIRDEIRRLEGLPAAEDHAPRRQRAG